MASALTDVAIRAFTGGTSRREMPDTIVRGLRLVVQPSGHKSWAMRFKLPGEGDRAHKLSIGPYPAVGLKEARRRATEARAAIGRGENPAEAKRAAKAAQKAPDARDTVEAVVGRFVERHAKTNTRERSWRETERLLRREVIGAWSGRKLADITRKDVHALLEAIVDREAPIVANRTLSAFRKLCAWALERDIIESSPCNGVRPPAREMSRDRVLTDDELRYAWRAFGAIGKPFGPIFKMMALTGQREGEVAKMRWSEIDIASATWVIPKERAKNDTGHIVPLTGPALAIFGELPRFEGCDLVFTTTGKTTVSGWSKAKARIDKLVGNVDRAGLPHWRLHDLRRTMASGCAALGVQPHVIEAAINHKSGTIKGVAAVYNRHRYLAETREALTRWGDHLTSLTR